MTLQAERPQSVPADPARPGSWWPAAVTGLVAAAAALGAGELVGAFFAPSPGPVIGVANRVIDHAPTWFVEFGKSIFGLADKPALILGTIIISLVLGFALGIASRQNRLVGAAGIAAFGIVGLLAVAVDPQGSVPAAIVVALTAVAVGVGVLFRLLRLAGAGDAVAVSSARAAATDAGPGETGSNAPVVTEYPTSPAVSRRSFLNWAGAAGVATAGAVVVSRSIRSRTNVSTARSAVTIAPEVDTRVGEILTEAASSELAGTPGLTPLVIPNDEFYLIDTALVKPQVDPGGWSMTIRGMVDREVTLTYEELLDRSTTVAPVTLSCVSNEIGGDLVGNAVWQGVPLVELLDEAGVRPGATQIASRSVDGWTCGFPTEAAYDGRTALVAVAMNGEPLPVAHGFPARLVVSGLYGYVSATKWLSEIELTTLEDFNGYWIPRGWSKDGPVKTQSRIDTPRRGERVQADTPVAIAGVAWAPDTGIKVVEVQIDDGEWQQADLGESLGADAWRQWVLSWTPSAGSHTIRVRATDESGYTQTSDRAAPAPSGATGWHEITVEAA